MQIAERALAHPSAAVAPLLSAAVSMHAWLEGGGTRPPIRAALIRHWTTHRLLRAPVPLTRPRALVAEVPFEAEVWIPLFLEAMADEADGAAPRAPPPPSMSWPPRRWCPRPRSPPGWAWR